MSLELCPSHLTCPGRAQLEGLRASYIKLAARYANALATVDQLYMALGEIGELAGDAESDGADIDGRFAEVTLARIASIATQARTLSPARTHAPADPIRTAPQQPKG